MALINLPNGGVYDTTISDMDLQSAECIEFVNDCEKTEPTVDSQEECGEGSTGVFRHLVESWTTEGVKLVKTLTYQTAATDKRCFALSEVALIIEEV